MTWESFSASVSPAFCATFVSSHAVTRVGEDCSTLYPTTLERTNAPAGSGSVVARPLAVRCWTSVRWACSRMRCSLAALRSPAAI